MTGERDSPDLDAWLAQFLHGTAATCPAAHGMDSPSFDVVIPSLPGYGWSSRPSRRGVTTHPRSAQRAVKKERANVKRGLLTKEETKILGGRRTPDQSRVLSRPHPNFSPLRSLRSRWVRGSDGARSPSQTPGGLAAIEEPGRFARRRFGHSEGIDCVAVLVGSAVRGERTREAFDERLEPWAGALGALVGRDRWPARSTLSRD